MFTILADFKFTVNFVINSKVSPDMENWPLFSLLYHTGNGFSLNIQGRGSFFRKEFIPDTWYKVNLKFKYTVYFMHVFYVFNLITLLRWKLDKLKY